MVQCQTVLVPNQCVMATYDGTAIASGTFWCPLDHLSRPQLNRSVKDVTGVDGGGPLVVQDSAGTPGEAPESAVTPAVIGASAGGVVVLLGGVAAVVVRTKKASTQTNESAAIRERTEGCARLR